MDELILRKRITSKHLVTHLIKKYRIFSNLTPGLPKLHLESTAFITQVAAIVFHSILPSSSCCFITFLFSFQVLPLLRFSCLKK